MQKIKNVTREMVRQVKMNFAPKYLVLDWNHYSPYGICGWDKRYITDTNGREVGFMNRDRLDQVIDFFRGKISDLRRGIREELCTHPEDACYLSIDGDTDYGFCKQYICQKCNGYLNKDDLVDRYTGGTKTVAEVCTYPAFIPRGYEEYTGEKFVKPFKVSYDTDHEYTPEQNLLIIEDIGFEQVLHQKVARDETDKSYVDDFYIYAHRSGWFLTLSTYKHEGCDETVVNLIELHYNLKFDNVDDARLLRLIDNGGFSKYPDQNDPDRSAVLSGWSDVSRGLRAKMRRIQDGATVMTQWQDQSCLSFSPYTDRYVDLSVRLGVSKKNYEQLPQWVKDMVGPFKA